MTERTTTCCIGDMFFRKRRYSSEVYAPSLKPKIPPPDNNDDRIKIPLEGMSRLQVQAEVLKAPSVDRTLQPTSTTCSTTSNPRLISTSDGLGSRRQYTSPSTPESGLTSESYSRAVQRPMVSYGSTGVTMSINDEPPPKYSPPKVHPRSAAEYVAGHNYHQQQQQSLPRSATKPSRGCGLIVDEVDKEQEILQTLWMENQQRQPAVSLNDRPTVSNGGQRTIMIVDRMTNATYRRGRLLGKGGFARCYEMTDMDTNVVYAGKVISKMRISKPRQRDKIMREIELHRSLRHPHVVEFHSYFEDEHNIYFILEYCSRKSLVDVLKSRQTLTESEVRYFMTQLVTGCKYVHSNHVIHRDLKLGNMLLNDNMQVKIADFGLATRIEYRGEKKMTVCGTPNYIAPEVIQRKGHSYEADIWSIGCIMYTLLCGRPPFETSSLKETYDRIANNQYVVPKHISPEATDLIARLLCYNPLDRPSLDAILRHEFFRSGYLPVSLSPSCCYSVPKFPAFEPPRPQSYAAPVSASHEARIVEQQLRRATSQRLPPRTRRPAPTATAKTEIKVQIEPVKEQLLEEDLLPDSKFSRMDSAGRLCSAVRLYKMLSSCLDVMPPDSFPTPVQNTKLLWVTKWVDYSNKYGFGYQLSDNSVGILFNDTTRMALLKDGKSLLYNDLSNRVVTINRDMIPNDLQKKVTLLIYFSQYMDEHLIYGANVDGVNKLVGGSGAAVSDNAPLNVCSGLTTSAVFMKKWFRTDRAIVMHLNNGTLQVNFFEDHTKVILSADAQDYLVTYIDASRVTVAYRLLQLRHFGCSAELVDRLDYARQSLKTVINIGSEAV